MIRNILQDIGGIGLYGIIALVLFFAVFFSMLIAVGRMKKQVLDDVSRLPLEDGECPAGCGHESL